MARAPAVQDIEALPEADRLEGFPHPRETRVLHGHAASEQALAAAFASGRMHHGWLITGLEGVGKATLAYRFATFLLADASERDPFGQSLEIDPETTAGRQVRALSHPGLLVLRRPWDFKAKRLMTAISIDEVRRLRSFLGHSGGETSWRVVIVDQADDLNVNAANALLKSLEEPPARTVFLLLASQPGRLLPTIRSRCRTLDLAPLQLEPLRKAVTQALTAAELEHPAHSQWPVLERLARGSVRRALALSTGGGIALYERILKSVSDLPRVDWATLHALGDELGGAANEQKFELWFELLLDLLGRLIRAQATGGQTGPGAAVTGTEDELKLARRLIGDARLASFAELWETIVAEKATALALNLDRKALILDTFVRLEAAAR